MEKRIVKLDCLFLHDTPMAGLIDEQRRARALQAAASGGPRGDGTEVQGERGYGELPFSVLPPFCISPERKAVSPLCIGAPEAADGWVFRPISAAPREDGTGADEWAYEPRGIPCYPLLPVEPGFILGYAGDRAGDIARRLRDAGARSFTVRLWYRATMTVAFEAEPGKHYGAQYAQDAPRWEKCR